MKIKKILFFIPFATTMLFSQPTGEKVFNKNCYSCHAEILGIVNDGGYDNSYITPAPYIYDLVKKLKEETKTKEEFSKFITEYIENPDKRKSLYGKKAIKKFGLMPSLKGLMSEEETTLLIDYLYNEEYKPKEAPKKVKKVAKIDPREPLFTNNCAACHTTATGVKINLEGDHEIIYEAPYIGDVVALVQKSTKSKEKFVEYIGNYINDPDMRKSLYGKKAIKKFGLMPSLKGAMSDEESVQLANYLYENYGEKK